MRAAHRPMRAFSANHAEGSTRGCGPVRGARSENQPNPPDFDKVEPALAYGFGAHEEYGQKYADWDEKLETRLSEEWDPAKTGMKFSDVKPYVRRGWDYRK